MDLFSYLLLNKHGGGGGGSAVDDGFYIVWDGNTEGRDIIDLTAVGVGTLYKVSSLVFDAEKLNGATFTIVGADYAINETNMFNAIGLVAALDNGLPLIISAKSGTHDIMGVVFEVPADGTYFLRLLGDGVAHVDNLRKPASV